jgi:alcohol dehydrogenase
MYLKHFEYQLPTRILYGIGKINELLKEVNKFKTEKALIITDNNLASTWIIKKIKDLLCANIEIEVLSNVVPNPTLSVIEEGIDFVKKFQPDVLLAIGGGSTMDAAKVIDIMLTNDGKISDYEKNNVLKNNKKLPLIAIPTTAGTGSEVTHVAVITDEKRKHKFAIADFLISPDLALLDPELTVTMPPKITAETGYDALAHALESYVSPNANHLSDSFSIYSIELISNNLREAVGNGENIEARSNMLLASMIAGLGFVHVGCGMGHGMGHTLSAFYNLGHGETLGMMLSYVTEYNIISNPRKYANFAKLMGENISGLSQIEAAKKAVYVLKSLAKDIGILPLKNSPIKESDISQLSIEASKDPCLGFNPRKLSIKEIEYIYKMALKG